MLKLTFIIPVHNEEGNIGTLLSELEGVMESVTRIDYEILFVDDGSNDQSMPVIMSYALTNSRISYISLSRNFGKDPALMAGIRYARYDAVITLDADLQHPPSLIPELIKWWLNGYEVVYAYRKKDNQHTGLVNKLRSRIFYKVINALSDIPLEQGISDYKLLDKKVIKVISQLPEDKPFLRGIIKWVGFNQKGIEYTPDNRYSGKTKYSFLKLLLLATDGLTSFSTRPLTFAIYLGFSFAAFSLMYIPYVLISLYYHMGRPGWASVIFTTAFFSGLQLMIMGILGLYLGKTFMQTKKRPRYIIQSSNIPEIENEIDQPGVIYQYQKNL